MTDKEFSSGTGLASSAGSAAARGAVLVGLAVLLGFLLLQQNKDGDDLVASNPVTTVASDDSIPVDGDVGAGATGSTIAPVATTLALAPARPNEDVRVLVVNGARVGGAASEVTTSLNSLSYITLTPSNIADGVEVLASSQVAFAPGYESEARGLASERGIPPEAVVPLPLGVETDSGETDKADVVLVLGRDLAGS